MSDGQPWEEATRDALAAEIARIDAITDPEEAWREGTELRDRIRGLTRGLSGEVEAMRARTARRIAKARELSLAGLADKIGLSRPRAQQLMNAAKAQEIPAPREDDHG